MHLPQKGQFLLSQYRTPHYPDHYLHLPSGYAECRQLPVDRFHVHLAYWPCARSRVFVLRHRIGYSEPPHWHLLPPLHCYLHLPPEPLMHCRHLPPVLLPLRCCRHPLEPQTHHLHLHLLPEPQMHHLHLHLLPLLPHHCRRPPPEPQAHRCRLHPLPEPLPLHRPRRQLDCPRHSKDRFLSRVH